MSTKISVGAFFIESHNGKLFIGHNSGELMEIRTAELEKILKEFFSENF